MFKVELSHTAEKELANFYKKDRSVYTRLINAIESLAQDPYQGKCLQEPLKGYRSLRVGTYRVIYSVCNKQMVVLVIDAGHRREIYR